MLKQFSSCVKTLTALSSWLGSQVLQIRLDFMEAFLKDEAKRDSAVNAYVTAVFQMITANKAIDHADVTRTLKSKCQARYASPPLSWRGPSQKQLQIGNFCLLYTTTHFPVLSRKTQLL